MQTQEQNQNSAVVPESKPGFVTELASAWRQVPDKTMFFGLLAAWLLLFHFLGNATLGYIPTPSLLSWMYTAYTLKSVVADDAFAILIPPLVLGLLFWKRKELLALSLRPWWPGLLLVAGALLLHLIGYAIQQPRVSIAALLGGIYALAGLVWGPAFLRASFFPFFLFGFMIPLGSLTEPITFPLRLLVSKSVALICQVVLGIDVVCEGTQLFNGMRTYQYEVAAACSGIRSLQATTVIAILYAFIVFPTWGKRSLLILSALPLAFIGNVFRMMTIVIAAALGGQRWGEYVHEGGPLGILSLLPYLPAIIGLFLLGRWLEKFPGRRVKADSPEHAGAAAP